MAFCQTASKAADVGFESDDDAGDDIDDSTSPVQADADQYDDDDYAGDDAGDDYDDADASVADTGGNVVLHKKNLKPIGGHTDATRTTKLRISTIVGRNCAMRSFVLPVEGKFSDFVTGITVTLGSLLGAAELQNFFSVKDRTPGRTTKGRLGNASKVHVARVAVEQIESSLGTSGYYKMVGAPFTKAKLTVLTKAGPKRVSGIIPDSTSTIFTGKEAPVFMRKELLVEHNGNNKLPEMTTLTQGLISETQTVVDATGKTHEMKVTKLQDNHPILPYLKRHMLASNSTHALQHVKHQLNKTQTINCWMAPQSAVEYTLSFLRGVHETLSPFDMSQFGVTVECSNPAEFAGITETGEPVHVNIKFSVLYVFA
jgi:hypothetical protein